MILRTRDIIEQIRHGIVPEKYKKTKAGILPADWDMYMLGDCLSRVEIPVEVKPNELYTQIGIRSHGKGLFYKEPVTGTSLGNKSVFWIEPDCFIVNIVFAWEQAIGKTTQSEVGMIGSHRFPMYRPVNDRVNVDYLLSFFLTKRGTDILKAASPGGAGRNKTLGQDRFLKSKIILPPIAEQQKIAEILTAQDKVIELKEKLLNEKQRQKKYLMQQLLTGKEIFSFFHHKYTFENLGNLCNIVKGQQLNKSTLSDSGKYYVLNGGITPSGFSDNWNTQAPCISISEGGNSCGYVNYNTESFWSGGHCYTLQNVSNRVMLPYLYFYLKANESAIMNLRVGSGLPNIQKSSIETFRILVPSLEKQTAIAEILSTADREIELLQKDIEQEKQKKKALMQLLLTGIVRV